MTVHVTVTGLTPGTVYHFHVAALNGAGSTAGQDRTFATTGPTAGGCRDRTRRQRRPDDRHGHGQHRSRRARPRPGKCATGRRPTTPCRRSPPTGWLRSRTSLPVSILLDGLAPGTLFHYQVVAYHTGGVTSYGADQTFFTEPSTRPKPTLSVRTTPSRSKRKPYGYTTSGSLGGAKNIPASAKCNGSVALKYYIGAKKIGNENGPVGSDCKFSVPNAFRHVRGPARITIKIHFNGNGYLTSVDKTNTVTAG